MILIILFKQWQSNYKCGLSYELFFRQLSRICFSKYLKKTQDPYERKVWQLFLELEQYSSLTMATLRERRSISTQECFTVNLASYLMAKGLMFIPGLTFRFIEKSAERFVSQLEHIKTLGPKEDQVLLSFMISHEQCLLNFLRYYNLGELDKAAQVFEDKFKEYYPKDKTIKK